MVQFLASKGVSVARGYGHGPSRKLRLISLGLSYLGLPSYDCHGIKREFFLFLLVKNLDEVIQCGHEPIWIDRPFRELLDHWKERWAIPRSIRTFSWLEFTSENFFKPTEEFLE